MLSKIMGGIIMLLAVLVISVSFQPRVNEDKAVLDERISKEAFLEVYKVLMSPRCMNCHPKGDVPLQGDDSHLHTMGVTRGDDGKGVSAMKCSNCHQATNTPGLNQPPGNPTWHLPPADMKMVFEGKSPRELAAQLKNKDLNGHKTMAQLIEHVSHDKLVLWGWDPGEGRTLPPLQHVEFVRQFKLWVDKGAVLPD
ncbi:hypothetical protein [Flavihumibacter solisilvae]|uniref:Cytochrome c domain-containing protein n=1 Tax=Flavihumibacter solisilvae TaxID=1349421 RepID=A0A0C1IWY7_9BACT|nr:hypothetical protein [Flavihumibacter solisilvae]KIC94984.1 hypothetical protein OI18_08845 [Flavihumibacter solisilvae]